MALTEEEEIEELRLLEALVPREGLADFIARISPHHPPPRHVAGIIAKIEKAVYEPIRLCISMPPRHAKTHLIQHAIAWWLANVSSADTCAYSSYNHEQATSKSRVTRDLAEMAGVQLNPDMANLSEWRTMDGGGLLSGGAGSGLTGKGVSGLMVVDDPLKDRVEANSKLIRDQRWDWFKDVVMTRLEGASVIVIHTRWHPDDMIGRIAKEMPEFEIVNLPAARRGGRRARAGVRRGALAEPVFPRLPGEAPQDGRGLHLRLALSGPPAPARRDGLRAGPLLRPGIS